MKKGKIYSILDEEFGDLSPSDDSYDAESAHRRPFYILRHAKRFPTRVRNPKEERNICKLNRR